MATLNSYYTTPLRNPKLGVNIEDFTPIARLALDTFVLWVNADSWRPTSSMTRSW